MALESGERTTRMGDTGIKNLTRFRVHALGIIIVMQWMSDLASFIFRLGLLLVLTPF